MKKYFVYELKKSLFVTCALAVIATAIYMISVLTELELDAYYRRVPIEFILVTGGVMSVIVPIWKLGYLMKKRSVDLYYSLPLSHTRILAVKFSVGIIALFASFTVAFWIGSFTAMASIDKPIVAVHFVSVYFASLIPMAVIYSLTAFIFSRANRFIDGVMFVVMTGMLLWIIAAVVLRVITICETFTEFTYYFSMENYAPFGPLMLIWEYFSDALLNIPVKILMSSADIVGLVLITVLGVASAIGIFFTERMAKAEDCEQISDSYFGYKITIPLYAFSFAFLGTSSYVPLTALSAIAVYAVSALYKRTLKIGWKFSIVVIVALVLGIVMSLTVRSLV